MASFSPARFVLNLKTVVMLAGSQSATWLSPVRARQKKFLNLCQLTALPWKCQLCCYYSLSQIYSRERRYKFRLWNVSPGKDGNSNEYTASRCVKRDSVENTATDFLKKAPLLFPIKAKSISPFTHLRDHRRFLCLFSPLICMSVLLTHASRKREKNKHISGKWLTYY